MMNINQLRKRLKYWQSMFGLTAWKITVSYVDLKEFQKEINDLAYGDIQYDDIQRVAKIRIVHPKHADQFIDPLPKPNPEETIVHELLHLVTDPIVKKMGSDAHEQLINLLTKILTNKETQ